MAFPCSGADPLIIRVEDGQPIFEELVDVRDVCMWVA